MQDGPQDAQERAASTLTPEDVDSLLAQWSHQGPLTREIILRLIDANGGSA